MKPAVQRWRACDLAADVRSGADRCRRAFRAGRGAACCRRCCENCCRGSQDWRLAPICVVEQGRVAIGDEIGAALGAQLCVVLIGERPGLSSPDSLGAYITWQPRPGRTDAERNCISNIRAEGLSYAQAAAQLVFYLTEARRRQLTGVALKEQSNLIEEGKAC